MPIQFGGLATGLDTATLITQLMNLERLPIARLETEKIWQNGRLAAFTELDGKLKAFADSIKTLGNSDTLLKRSVKQSASDFLTASVSSEALAGSSYQVEVLSLAQMQKSVTESGVTSKTDSTFGTGDLNLTVGGVNHTIAITADNNSLEGIMQAINNADMGVNASIINDGSDSPYRLVLSGKSVSKTFSLDSSGLTGGTDNLGAMNLDNGSGGIINPPTQAATRAHIRVDTIDIYSDSNILKEAIPGVTLDLMQAQEGSFTTLTVNLDQNSITSAIQAFAKGYNEVISFITGQSVINEEGGGVLGGDSGINTIKRHLQNMLTTPVTNDGVFSTLSQLGFKTQKDGTLLVDDKVLSDAVAKNLDSVVSLLAGNGEKKGIIEKFQDYLGSMTNTSTGMLQGRNESINNSIKRINSQIESMEMRLTQRQKVLESQFSAMEILVGNLNSQSAYLNQQMTAITNIMNYNKGNR
jgi:Flagellar capping protein